MLLDCAYTMHAYYNANGGYSPAMNLTDTRLGPQFLCTNEKITRYDITIGSVIRLTSDDYKYSPEGWIALNEKVESDDRPPRVSAEHTVVDAAWWGDWNYRAFNVQTKDASEITDAGQAALRIYVKIA